MRDTSIAFKESENKILPKMKLTFTDGRVLQLEEPELFKSSGTGFTDAAGQNSFALGATIAKTVTLALWNDDERYSDYDFFMCTVEAYGYRELEDGTVETIKIGNFTVTEPEIYGTTVEVTGVDDMYKLNSQYSTALTFPARMDAIVRDSCATCGVTLLTTTFKNGDFIVQEKPENITHRQLIGYAAQIACGNARFDAYNRLCITSYDFTAFEAFDGIYGGIFDSETPYKTGDTADGGSFNPWDTGYVCNAGDFSLMDSIHILSEFRTDPTKSTDDVVITGIQTKDGEENYLSGTSGYVLSIDNPLTTGKAQEAADLIAKSMIGIRFRPFSGKYFSNLSVECMDLAFIFDWNGRGYRTVLTDISYSFSSYTTLTCKADDPVRNSSSFESEAAKAIVAARKNTKKQISDYDKAVQMLTSLITQSFGVYKTEEILSDGSVIYYMHNKPTLAESSTIWKMTADAFAVSTDSGNTWNAGVDASGNAVVNVLSAIGISFNWASGGSLKLGGANNGNGALYVYDASGTQIGYWTKDGFYAKKGTFAGALSAATGTFTGTLSAAGGTFKGSLSAATGTFGGTVSAGKVTGSEIVGSKFETESSNGSNSIVIEGAVQEFNATSSEYGSYAGAIAPKVIYAERTDGEIELYGDVPAITLYGKYATAIGIIGESIPAFAVMDTNIAIAKDLYGENQNIFVNGVYASGTKSRVADTENYGTRTLYCYETPSPYFGDIGTGKLDENGSCYVEIDDIFSETVRTDLEYCVFLQKEGPGDIWIEEKEYNFFSVKGTPGLSFSWEIKAVQKDFETLQLEEYGADPDIHEDNLETAYEEELSESDGIEELYEEEIENYETEMEEIYDEQYFI